jgi:Holliday junction resolvase RusA-like endonuclease
MTRSFTPKRTASFQNLVRMAFSLAYPGFSPMDGPVSMAAFFYMPIPESMPKKIRAMAEADENAVPHIKKPDGKNMRWGVEDALEGVAFNNDSQVYQWRDRKTYSTRPRVVVEIRRMG